MFISHFFLFIPVLPGQTAVFIVMGANIGTSVTNTIVAMGHVLDKDEFRRAFGGATVHDMFNWLAVFCLLPIEAISCKLLHRSEIVKSSQFGG